MSDTLIGCIKQSLGMKTVQVEVPFGYEVVLRRKRTIVANVPEGMLIRCGGCNEWKDKHSFTQKLIVSSNCGTGYCKECNSKYGKLKYKERAYKEYK